MDKGSIVIVGIICITILECFAIANGIDGWYFTLVIAAIAGAIGVEIPILYNRFKENKDAKSSNH